MPIHLFGSDEQKERFPTASGRRLAAFGLTEPDGAPTRARREPRPSFVTAPGSSTARRCSSRTPAPTSRGADAHRPDGDDEVSNIVVENGTPGYTISAPLHKLGWKASDTRELTFSGCECRRATSSGRVGRASTSSSRSSTAAGLVAAMGVGLAQGATRPRVRVRERADLVGKPIASFQVSFKLVDMAVEIEAGRQLVYRAAWLKDQGRSSRSRPRWRSSPASFPTGWSTTRSDPRWLRVYGRVRDLRFYRDQKILEIGEGTNEVSEWSRRNTSALTSPSRFRND